MNRNHYRKDAGADGTFAASATGLPPKMPSARLEPGPGNPATAEDNP